MKIEIQRNCGWAKPKKYEKIVNSYEEAKKCIAKLGKKLKYTDEYWIKLYILRDEFDKVSPFVPNTFGRKLDVMESWLIVLDMRGLIIFEDLQNEIERIIFDPFIYKADEIKVGDYVYSEKDNRYFIVGADLKEGSDYRCFDGTEEADEWGIDGIPLKYIHKVSDYEIEQLNLKRLQEIVDAFQVFGHSDDYYNLIDKFKKESPWL